MTLDPIKELLDADDTLIRILLARVHGLETKNAILTKAITEISNLYGIPYGSSETTMRTIAKECLKEIR